jgi:hypothetical protein
MKQMLQDTVPVTAFVPVDSVSDEQWVCILQLELPAASSSAAAGWPLPMPAGGASQALSAFSSQHLCLLSAWLGVSHCTDQYAQRHTSMTGITYAPESRVFFWLPDQHAMLSCMLSGLLSCMLPLTGIPQSSNEAQNHKALRHSSVHEEPLLDSSDPQAAHGTWPL